MSTKKEKCSVPYENHVWDSEELNPHCHICGLLMRDDSVQSESIECERQFDWFGYRFSSTSESIEWEKEFDSKYIRGDFGDVNEKGDVVPLKSLKDFIRDAITTAVAKREESYREEILDKLRNATCYSDPSRGVLLSNPPQHRCDACGKLWYVGDKAPVCEYIRKADITNLKH